MALMPLRVERRMVPHVPWGLVAAALGISILGIWNLASAVRPPHAPLYPRQGINLAVGLFLALIVCLVDYRFIQRAVVPIYGLNLASLLLLHVLGHKAKGESSWFAIGPVRIEPAEFMKVGVVLMLAKFFHDDYRQGDPPYGLLRLWKPVLIVLVPVACVLPDLGNAMMITLTAVTIFLFAKLHWSLLATGLVGLVAVSGIIWNDYSRDPADGHRTVIRHILKKHQSQRIAGWLDPEQDLKGSGYHAAQSKIAVGSGGLWGRGWRQGTQTGLSFLPEQHTDFIFSVWAEEHGFFACLLLVVLYGLIFTFSLGVAFQARERFGAFLAVGVSCMIFWQVFENMGMVIGLLPVTGITLPLMSYGGSSVVCILVSLGLLTNVAMRRHMF
jgi:rod shape determining protein RodA